MSNIKAARQAIEKELKHVEQGIAYYQARAESLRQALEQLDSVDADQPRKAAKSRTTAAKATGGARRGRKPKESSQALPRTTSQFWLNLISQEPRSAADIVKAAIDSLGFSPSPEQTKKLKQRVAPALHALLAAKQIKDVGSGRQRRFFLPLGKPAPQAKQSKAKGAHAGTNGTMLH